MRLQFNTALIKVRSYLRSFSEQWIKGKSINRKNQFADQFNEIISKVNELNYSEVKENYQQFNKQNQDPEIDRLTGVISRSFK